MATVVPPTNIGVRTRTATDAGPVQPLAPVREIPTDLPELLPGQGFTARIQEALADNTYRALVTGKQVTLQLPEGAKPGETLELVVVDRTPKTLIAHRAETSSTLAGRGEPYPHTRISGAGQMIGQLLPPEGEAPRAAPLNRGEPLLPQAPRSGTELAATLERAVQQSGLFYESHQAQWVAGKRSLDSLLAEPQGQLPVAPRPTAPHSPAQANRPAGAALPEDSMVTLSPQARRQEAGLPTMPESSPQASGRMEGQTALPPMDRTASAATSQSTPTVQSIPEEVRPLVQQQLDAVATQRLAWHGEVWPGQSVEWSVEQERIGDREAKEGDEASRWTTTLNLSMPRLGTVDATLELAGSSLRLRLRAKDEEAAADLRRQMPELVRALAEAGLMLQSSDVRREA